MSADNSRQAVLLESGNNEIELIEFYLGSQPFGINVYKLREIIPFDEAKTTRIPECLPSVVGTFEVRGHSIPLVDLNLHLKRTAEPNAAGGERKVVLVCEFNQRVNGFLVDGVNRIHRISWSDISPLSSIVETYRPRFTGSFNIDQREILIVDLEYIISEIDPEADLDRRQVVIEDSSSGELRESLIERRRRKKLFLAEDSSLIRESILRVLKEAGYTDVESFVNGEDCFQAIQRAKQGAGEAGSLPVELLISDIEMPKMDGLTLCKRIKEDPLASSISVVMFSSLISEQMKLHCDRVGANGCISKPEIAQLVALLDNLLL